MVMSVIVPVMATEGEVVDATGIEVLAEVEPTVTATPTVTPIPTVSPTPTVTPGPTVTPELMPTEVPESTPIIEPTVALTEASSLIPDPSVLERINNLEQYSEGEFKDTELGTVPNYGFYMDTPDILARGMRSAMGTYEGINWSFDSATGTLSLTGSGRIKDRTGATVLPWAGYLNSITKLVIGSGITEIGNSVFYEHSYIVSVTLPTTLKTIGIGAFADCISLANINIPEGLEAIEDYAFQRCLISSVNIPSSVTKISSIAFFKCTNLSSLVVSPENNSYSADNSILYSKDKKALIMVPNGHPSTNLTIPAGTTTIKMSAFAYSKIKSITLPNTLTTLEDYVFYNSELTELTIPDSVISAGDEFASECKSLKTVKIGKGLKELPRLAFACCNQLENVSLPNEMKVILNGAFAECSSLKTIILPAELETIAYQAFLNCTKLQNVIIPNKVKHIYRVAFWNTALTKVVLPASLEVLGYEAFPPTCQVIYPTGLIELDDGTYMRVGFVYIDSQLKYKEAFEVLKLVNQERAKVGAPALKMDKELLAAGMLRAEEISIYFDHDRPTGKDCFTASSKMFGENIAVGLSTATGVMNQWMNSAGHKANILSSGFTSIGIGCTVVDGRTYWTQTFGTGIANTASSSSYADKNYEAVININPSAEFYVPKMKAEKDTIYIGDTTMLKFQCYNTWVDTAIKAKSVTFTNTNNSICTVDGDGKITAKSAGSTTITAHLKNFSAKKVSVKITVKPQPIFTVKYHANYGKGTMADTIVTYGSKAQLRANSFTRTNYTFRGWYLHRKSDDQWLYTNGSITYWGNGYLQYYGYKLAEYKDKADIGTLTNGDKDIVTAYAAWTENNFTVTYNASGGKGTMSETTVPCGYDMQLGRNKFTKNGYVFVGWNVHRKSSNEWEYINGKKSGWYKKDKQPKGYKLKVYKDRNTLAVSGIKDKDVVTIYAVWKANKYSITYNKNGGKGKISATKATYGKNTKLKANTFKRAKYKFAGWTTYRKSDKKWLYVKGSKTGWYKKNKQPVGYKLKTYKNKAKVKNLTTKANDTIVMYAKWKKK